MLRKEEKLKLRNLFPTYASHGSTVFLQRANTGLMHSFYSALGFHDKCGSNWY